MYYLFITLLLENKDVVNFIPLLVFLSVNPDHSRIQSC